ncbi:MAG: DUF6642 family protein [Symbiobacteriia bacterium]
MKRFKNYPKKIACLEGDWGEHRDRRSVEPVLRLLEANSSSQTLFRRCNTDEEFRYHLGKIARLPSFEILYLAFHGEPGRIMSYGPLEVSLEDLAEIMGQRFCGRIVHFGSCATLDVDEDRIREFLDATGVAAVTGFDSNVDWVESSAFELLMFVMWQSYKQIGAFKRHLLESYGELGSRLGFRMCTAEDLGLKGTAGC